MQAEPPTNTKIHTRSQAVDRILHIKIVETVARAHVAHVWEYDHDPVYANIKGHFIPLLRGWFYARELGETGTAPVRTVYAREYHCNWLPLASE